MTEVNPGARAAFSHQPSAVCFSRWPMADGRWLTADVQSTAIQVDCAIKETADA
jgi:hypothetical protein